MKQHKCLDLINEELKRFNTRLVANMLNDGDVFVATEKIRILRDGKSAKTVIAAYCPFCGKKIVRKKTPLC